MPGNVQGAPGEHEAIIDRKTWDKVQALIEKNRTNHRVKGQAGHPSPLAGMLADRRLAYSCRGDRVTRYEAARFMVR